MAHAFVTPVTLGSRWFYALAPNLAVEVRAVTRKAQHPIWRLAALALLLAANAWAAPCTLCAGCEGGFARGDGVSLTVSEPCAPVVVCVPCRGEPYVIP